MRSLVVALVAVLLLAAGCNGSSPTAAGGTGATPTISPAAGLTVQTCPTQVTHRFTWPVSVPQDLPEPPSAVFLSTQTSLDGVTIVRLSSTLSLEQAVLYVINAVQKAGYTLGRGDAEPAEADAPFGRGDIRGLYKMIVRDTCRTDFLVAIATVQAGFGSPVLQFVHPGPSASPLPFN